jgi:DMSO/TMAO reductase YedYZ molybdopterin-dependent catalytic subunit
MYRFIPSAAERVSRRDFLVASAVAGAAACSAPLLSAQQTEARTPVPGKDPRLIVHTSTPLVLETPPELLLGSQITPADLLFVRNNAQPEGASTIKPLSAKNWKIEVGGMLAKPVTIDAADLLAVDQVEHEMVLQCSGNSRSLFAHSAATKGTQWGRGGMGNVRLAGVRLAALVDRYQIKIDRQARFITASGADEPAGTEHDFEHSLPLDEALARSFIALRMGDGPLPAIHGGPVRLVTPGYYGTMHIKWLNKLLFTVEESKHTSQIPHYRTPRAQLKPGSPFDFTFQNSDPNWAMKVKCVVLSPSAGARLIAGKARVEGVAFNDGKAPIEVVLVSTDRGESWQRCEIRPPKSPYAWSRWRVELPLTAGKQQIWAQAIDALGRGQPVDGSIAWNPQGYTWNGIEKIEVEVG